MIPPTTISRALSDYLTDWLAWVDRGAPDGEPYARSWGLCSNAALCDAGAHSELGLLFGDSEYPFGTREQYIAGGADRTQHLNEARLAWVRSTLATAEIEG